MAAPTTSIWKNFNFVLLWSGQFVSAFGTKVSGLALPLLVLALTNSPAQAGFVASARMVPYLILGLPAGALVDRWNRKTVMIVCDLVRAASLGSVPLAWWLGHLTVAQLYVVAFAQGTAFVFFNVAEYAALTSIVEPESLPNATALDSTAWSTASLLGPGLAGFVIGLAKTIAAGAVLGFLVDGVTFLVSVLSLFFLKLPNFVAAASTGIGGEIKEGVIFVWKNPPLRTLIASATLLTFLYAPVSLAMIVIARDGLRVTPTVIGLIFSVSAAGGVAGSLAAPWAAKRFRLGSLVASAVAVQAVVTVAVALAQNPYLMAAGWTVAFFLDPVLYTASASFRLSTTPPNLQARVQSIFRLGLYGAEPIGAALGGLAITGLGPRGVILTVAAGVACCSGWLGFGPLRKV